MVTEFAERGLALAWMVVQERPLVKIGFENVVNLRPLSAFPVVVVVFAASPCANDEGLLVAKIVATAVMLVTNIWALYSPHNAAAVADSKEAKKEWININM
jgi:hypothetical protein